MKNSRIARGWHLSQIPCTTWEILLANILHSDPSLLQSIPRPNLLTPVQTIWHFPLWFLSLSREYLGIKIPEGCHHKAALLLSHTLCSSELVSWWMVFTPTQSTGINAVWTPASHTHSDYRLESWPLISSLCSLAQGKIPVRVVRLRTVIPKHCTQHQNMIFTSSLHLLTSLQILKWQFFSHMSEENWGLQAQKLLCSTRENDWCDTTFYIWLNQTKQGKGLT